MIRDTVLMLWFLLTAIAFFGPYLGLPAPVPTLGMLYAVMLVAGVVAVAWDVSRRRAADRAEKVQGGEDGH